MLPKSLQDTILGCYRCEWPPKVRMSGLLANKPEKYGNQKLTSSTRYLLTFGERA